ncbi:MAG: lipopolysaccharide transport periplasmic protein LptA [Planktomarina sp.]
MIGLAAPLAAQTTLSFGGLNVDPNAQVEMTADKLSVSQTDGAATFEGNVIIGQGNMRIAAQKVVVTYKDGGGIEKLDASGGVTFVTGTEAAEAQTARYSLGDQTLRMRGNVLLTQGQNALTADAMFINLATGAAVMEGRVKTVLNTGGSN